MSKKELQAFMKAKLSKTKVSANAMSGISATGPGQNNFAKKKEPDNDWQGPSTKNKDINMPGAAPAMYRPGNAEQNADLRTSQTSLAAAKAMERTGSRSAVRCKE